MSGRLPFDVSGTISEFALAPPPDEASVVGCARLVLLAAMRVLVRAAEQYVTASHRSRAIHAPTIAQVHPSNSAPIPLIEVGLYDHGAGASAAAPTPAWGAAPARGKT